MNGMRTKNDVEETISREMTFNLEIERLRKDNLMHSTNIERQNFATLNKGIFIVYHCRVKEIS